MLRFSLSQKNAKKGLWKEWPISWLVVSLAEKAAKIDIIEVHILSFLFFISYQFCGEWSDCRVEWKESPCYRILPWQINQTRSSTMRFKVVGQWKVFFERSSTKKSNYFIIFWESLQQFLKRKFFQGAKTAAPAYYF
jgi:hypothetical protein